MEQNSERNSSDEMTTIESLKLTDLPYDIIHQILSYLDIKSLCRVGQVCRYFRHVACKDSLWLRHLKRQAVQIENNFSCVESECRQNERSVNIRRRHPRVNQGLSRKIRFKAGDNWKDGIFRASHQISHPANTKLMPWIQRQGNNLWVSTGKVIRCFRIQKNGNLSEWKGRQLRGLNDDVSRFVVKDERIISACSDGSICGWSYDDGQMLFHYTNLHTTNVHCVDVFDQMIVSGSRDKTVKILSIDENYQSLLQRSIYMGDRVWSLNLSPDPSILAVGTAGIKGVPALTIWDVNRCEMLTSLDRRDKVGAGVLDMKFNNHQSLLTCGYDTNLRLWDLRTNTCVATWMEPFDMAIHCFQTDGNNCMVTGTARYGMTRLWDRRKNTPIQQYYTGRVHSSPVYSLTFDPGRLYTALDSGVHKLDFT